MRKRGQWTVKGVIGLFVVDLMQPLQTLIYTDAHPKLREGCEAMELS